MSNRAVTSRFGVATATLAIFGIAAAALGWVHPTQAGVRMVLTFDAMHDETWTERAVMGWEMEIGKLAERLATNAKRSP